jgi:cytochrome c biogenesis factor
MGNALLVVSLVLVLSSIVLWLLYAKSTQHTIPLIFSVLSMLSITALFAFYAFLFFGHQFQYVQVHQHSNMAMSKPLLLASIWSGQSGSMLAWILSLTLFSGLVFKDKQNRSKVFPLLFLFLGILLIMFVRSSPFALNPLLPADGLGLNPVLSHPLMIIHPPFAFIAYSCIILAFIYALISLTQSKPDALIKKISLLGKMAFASLSFAILLGSLWAYEATGWGGYWSFDPIENGSLIAFLLLSLLMHLVWSFQRYRIHHKQIVLCSIFLMFSIIHMVFLIRSGLLSQVSAHSYVEGNLIWILLGIDLLVLIAPLSYFSLFHHKLPNPPKVKFSSKSKVLLFSHWLLIGIIGLLFVYTHLPFFESSTLGLLVSSIFSYFSVLLLILGLGILFLLLLFHKHAFRRKHSKQYSPEKFLILFFISFVLCYLFQPSLPISILSLKGMLIVFAGFLSLACLYAILYYLKKTPFKLWGALLVHSSLPLIVFASILISLPSKTYWLHLIPQETISVEELSASFSLSSYRNLPIYTGILTEYPIQVSIRNSNYTAKPSIWSYHRNQKNSLEIMKTSTHSILGSDHHLVPTGKGIFRIKEASVRFIGDIKVSYIEYKQEELSNGLFNEWFTLNFSHDGQSETVQLKRLSNTQGAHLRSDPVYVKILNDTIQLTQHQNQTIVFSSNALKDHLEANYHIKTLSNLIPWSYYLLLLSALWILLQDLKRKSNNSTQNKEANQCKKTI